MYLAFNNKMSKVQDKGEIDKSLENGPTEKRECRDVLCCLLFICAVGLAGYVFINGLVLGQPEKLVLLYDSMANECSGSVTLTIIFSTLLFLTYKFIIVSLYVLCKSRCHQLFSAERTHLRLLMSQFLQVHCGRNSGRLPALQIPLPLLCPLIHQNGSRSISLHSL